MVANTYETLIGAGEELEVARDLLSSVRDYHQSVITEKQNDIIKTLTVIASLVLVPTLIVGFYGQNFVPVFDEDYWTLAASLGLIAASTVAQLAVFRWRRLDLTEARMAASSFEPDLSAWDAWHPSEVARLLRDVKTPWYVTAGWALDLFRGRQTREHDDLEIAVPADRLHGAPSTRFPDYDLYVIGGGLAHPLTPETLAEHHQTWVRERATGRWRLDIMREPWVGDTWVFRRDARIRLPRDRVIAHTADGIPYARPEIALLYKAKDARPKDDDDFAGVLPLLETVGAPLACRVARARASRTSLAREPE